MAKALKCGNKPCWIVMFIVGLIILLVGVILMVSPQTSSGNDLDHGCWGGGCCEGGHCKVDASASEPSGTTCDDAMKRCEAGEDGFRTYGHNGRTYKWCAERKCNNRLDNTDPNSLCIGYDTSQNPRGTTEITKGSDCNCFEPCGEAVVETVVTWFIGVVMTILGIVFSATFVCGVVPCCCFAKEEVNVIPTSQPMVAQPMWPSRWGPSQWQNNSLVFVL